jgi:hypothetical protein
MVLVTLKTYDTPVEAHLLKTKLESVGIPSVLKDENMSSLYPFYSVMGDGAVKLQIHPKDLDRAQKLICEIEESPYTKEDGSSLRCPVCGQTDFYSGWHSHKGWRGLMIAMTVFLGLSHSFSKGVYRCKTCGNEFDGS